MCGCRGGGAAAASRNQPAREMAAPAAAKVRRISAPGEKCEDCVLAQFIQEWGSPLTKNGNKYPPMSRGELWWIHKKDVLDHPKWWREVAVTT